MKLPIAEKKEIIKGTVEIAFDISGRQFDFKAGQYIWVNLPKLLYPDERGLARCFSVVSSPNDKKFFKIAFRDSDSGFKKTLAEMAPGAEVEIDGPLGDMTLPENVSAPLVFVAGGIGITPFLSMLRFAAENKIPYKITVFYANRNRESAAYAEELEELARQNPNIILINHLGPVDETAIKKNISAEMIKTAHWYIVGPPAMAMETEKILSALGVARHRVRLTEFVGYLTPLTAKKSEILPGLSEAVLQALDKNVLVSITDLRGTIIYANDKFVETSKYSRDELIGKNHRMLKSGFHGVKFYEELWSVISEGRTWRGEIKNRAKDSSFYWVDANIAPIIDAKNKPLGYVAIRFLITERKELEESLTKKTEEAMQSVKELEYTRAALLNVSEDLEAEKEKVEAEVKARTRELQEEKARLLASINSLSFGFLIADKKDNILLKNPAALNILGVGDSLKSVTEIAGLFGSNFDMMGVCEKCISEKIIVMVKDISYGSKYLNISCVPIFFSKESNNVSEHVVLIEDETEAKVLERSRDEFFAVASHELRTPLTAIRGNAEMIQEFYGNMIKDQELKDMLKDIQNGSVRLIEIVNDFLDVSRIEQGKITLKKEKFDMLVLIEKVCKELKNSADEKNIAIKINADKSLPQVFADRARAEQILVNIIGNAIKFTKDGGITADVVLFPENMLKVSVSDTGIGISLHSQALLFRKFQQAGEKMLARDVTQGTGLGLYIARLLVESMGGKIWLEKSEPGKGSVFCFTLPIAS